ncbi:DUF2281 domain-containing protein [Phormidium sp. FACHB-1136]|uniref:DUF2281 domain-containing protein n=1 Tax=Phormidium sp. FACHB-1136 TaxID=2692848 RepID=UPI0018EFDC2D|nr:DUF2281 domain-containing protein [Phormidium sp. FACHB-1136]
MPNLEQLQQDFQSLPEEAQNLLINYMETLKQQYLKPDTPSPESTTSPYQKFKESGFIGCVSIEENLSTTYKQVLSEKWVGQKTKPKSIGISKSEYSDLSERVDDLLWQE